jgi:16S rRNA (adenine1518-N6/adenine1519-N6)-dimethyltransferase
MILTSTTTIKKLLEKYEIKPFKGLGQNFLINEAILKKIVEAADVTPKDTILEIGPGIGTLTQELAEKAKKIITVEKDKKMVKILKETLNNFKNVKIIEQDILKFPIPNFQFPIKVVANLPYNIASAVIRKFSELDNPPKEMILMVQKEVARRICAKPPDMNLLAVSVQFYSEAKILFYVSKNNFWPKPKVDGAVIKLKLENKKWKNEKDLFFKIVKAGFSQPRKQLVNNLSNELKLKKEEVKTLLLKNKILPKQRAETLDLKDWIELTKNYTINQ